jgi:hypothetical protein
LTCSTHILKKYTFWKREHINHYTWLIKRPVSHAIISSTNYYYEHTYKFRFKLRFLCTVVIHYWHEPKQKLTRKFLV